MRAFLALPIPDAHASALAKLANRLPEGRAVDPDQMHITALFLGEPPMEALEDLHAALDGITFTLPALTIEGLGHFGHNLPRVAYANVAPARDLSALHKRLTARAHQTGLRLDKRHYVPHVTLARYTRGAVFATDLAQAFGNIGRLGLSPFQPHALDLMTSQPAKRGHVYETLASYPVTPGPTT